MKLITVKQLMKKSKTALIRKITKSLRSMPKKKLAMLCYEMSKSKLPRLRKRKSLPRLSKFQRTGKKEDMIAGIDYYKDMETLLGTKKPKRKTKRKFSRKQLAAQRLFAKRARAGTLRRRKR